MDRTLFCCSCVDGGSFRGTHHLNWEFFVHGNVYQILFSHFFTLPEINSSPLRIDSWKKRFLLETTIFRGELLVSGRVNP